MRLRKECPQCNTVVHVKRSVCDCGRAFASKKRKAQCTAVGEPENAMKRRKTLLSEEELLVTKERDKVPKVSKRASETCEQTLHRQEQNQTHLACAEGSALQCCSLTLGAHAQRGLQYLVCVCVCLSVCLLLNISLFTCLFVPQTILTFLAADEGRKF